MHVISKLSNLEGTTNVEYAPASVSLTKLIVFSSTSSHDQFET